MKNTDLNLYLKENYELFKERLESELTSQTLSVYDSWWLRGLRGQRTAQRRTICMQPLLTLLEFVAPVIFKIIPVHISYLGMGVDGGPTPFESRSHIG